MFDPDDTPRAFALPPGVDFPAELVSGLIARFEGHPPEALARVHLIVNTSRMARRIREIFDTGEARLLPQISLVSDLTGLAPAGVVPPAISPLRRRLELAQLIAALLEREPDLAARSSTFDLSDSLAALMDEMQGEGVDAATIRALDVTDMSGHWERAQRFIGIAESYLNSDRDLLDPQARQRRLAKVLGARWRASLPEHPVIIAGSTGSRGTTRLLMQAVAQLPKGAVVLPGFDFDQPARVWSDMADARVGEDHPQYRFHGVLTALGLGPDDVRPWTAAVPPVPDRNRLVSLALRPAPFTDAWLDEGPALKHLGDACSDVALIEAQDPRTEALCIAMRLRAAAESGEVAALITPDRMLTRRVAASLDLWGILPDDSAGVPLQLTPPGRFLRQVAILLRERLNNELLIGLLKHPLCHSGAGRGEHLRHTRDLELFLRKAGPPVADAQVLRQWCDRSPKERAVWVSWLASITEETLRLEPVSLKFWVERLRSLAERLAAGSAPGAAPTELWNKKAGEAAAQSYARLVADADHGGQITAHEFGDLLGSVLSGEEVRDRDAPHRDIRIWGTLEARVQGADLLILGGLNEGTWPESAAPDPWLNRRMRLDAGLLLPERRIGLAAHDFQQAIAARKVVLTRSILSDEAETVPSRWLNRVTNLLSGLRPDGEAALAAMRERGQVWIGRAQAFETANPIAPAHRPSPRPPVDARPRVLRVTEIQRLIRDPYAIYARRILNLQPLDPLVCGPDALIRGIAMHTILEQFVQRSLGDPQFLNRDSLIACAAEILDRTVPWPIARSLWMGMLRGVAEPFLNSEVARQKHAKPVAFEVKGELSLTQPEFKLVGRADRIDRDQEGRLRIYDYKTGQIPNASVQKHFDKQLLIEAAMAEAGAFENLPATEVISAAYLRVGTEYDRQDAPLEESSATETLASLSQLISAYLSPDQGFTSRRMPQKDSNKGDYDHLARFGEWEPGSKPHPEDLK